MKLITKMVSRLQGNLNSQYIMYRCLMWGDLLIALVFACTGNAPLTFAFTAIALLLGALSNDKLLLLITGDIRDTHNRIEDKIDMMMRNNG